MTTRQILHASWSSNVLTVVSESVSDGAQITERHTFDPSDNGALNGFFRATSRYGLSLAYWQTRPAYAQVADDLVGRRFTV